MSYYKAVVRTKVNVNLDLDPSIWFLNRKGHELFSEVRETHGCKNFMDCLQSYFDSILPGNRISVYSVSHETIPVLYTKRGVIKALMRGEEAKNTFKDVVDEYFLDVDLDIKEIDIETTPLRRKRDLSRRL